jgi:hypothetical protein
MKTSSYQPTSHQTLSRPISPDTFFPSLRPSVRPSFLPSATHRLFGLRPELATHLELAPFPFSLIIFFIEREENRAKMGRRAEWAGRAELEGNKTWYGAEGREAGRRGGRTVGNSQLQRPKQDSRKDKMTVTLMTGDVLRVYVEGVPQAVTLIALPLRGQDISRRLRIEHDKMQMFTGIYQNSIEILPKPE